MRRLFTATLATVLVAAVAASPLLAKTHSFKLYRASSISGTQLDPGSYKLELKDQGEALIYRKDELVAKARVELKPLSPHQVPGSVVRTADGTIREIRLKKQVVVFAR